MSIVLIASIVGATITVSGIVGAAILTAALNKRQANKINTRDIELSGPFLAFISYLTHHNAKRRQDIEANRESPQTRPTRSPPPRRTSTVTLRIPLLISPMWSDNEETTNRYL